MFNFIINKLLITCLVILVSCIASNAQADLTLLNSGVTNQPSGTTITWHTGALATTSNLIINPTNVVAGTYYMAFYDATNDCYSTNTLAVPVICTPATADLTVLDASVTNNPGAGVVVSWHTALPADSSSLVPNSSAVNPGIYYASFYDTVNICYAIEGTPVLISNCGGSVLLPINIVNFSGEKQDLTNLLRWETSTEINSNYFVLEKSRDGMSFKSIATLLAKGDVNVTTNYHYVDANPFYGDNYYRLRIVDLNNSYSYSQTIMIDFGITNEQAMLVYPNPAKNELNLSCHINEGSEFVLEIMDVLGEVVEQRQLSMVEGVNNFVLPLEDYAVGTYLLRITNGLISKTQLFIKE